MVVKILVAVILVATWCIAFAITTIATDTIAQRNGYYQEGLEDSRAAFPEPATPAENQDALCN